jgi:Flp pilus assembly protein CpaB
MSITVSDAQAAGGSVQPGDFVDVLFSFTFDPVKYFQRPDPTKSGPDISAKIVLERVPILARTLAVYTIRTDAATAERIGYIQASGGVMQLLLRGPKDERATGATGATFKSVYPVFKFEVPEKIQP